MALDQPALLELLDVMRSADGGELMRRLLATILQLLVDAEATAFVGAEPYERSAARTNRRNGTRGKLVATATGDLTIKIPKVRAGSFFPSLLSPRRRVDVALHAVVMQAWVEGVSTRKVDDLVAALGVESGISKSQVSEPDLCSARCRRERLARQVTGRAGDAVRVPRCHLLQSQGQRTGGVAGSSDRHGDPLTGAVRCSAARSETVRARTSGPSSSAACATGACTACSWSSPTLTAAWSAPSARSASAPHGNAHPSTSLAAGRAEPQTRFLPAASGDPGSHRYVAPLSRISNISYLERGHAQSELARSTERTGSSVGVGHDPVQRRRPGQGAARKPRSSVGTEASGWTRLGLAVVVPEL